MNATEWSRGLDVIGGRTGVVSHAGLVLLRKLADRTGLTAGLSAALPSPLYGHDRGRVLVDLARREWPHPGAQLSLFETTDGWRYSLWATNLPGDTRGLGLVKDQA